MRAKRVFRTTLLAAALAAAGHVQALGLGRLTVDSALGQPLSARIDLTSATREDLDSLTARVADPSLYRQNNLAFQPALSRTRVTLEQGPTGPYLRVTSPTAVNEPYLDLMVEVNWASGRVVRSYTFLLDPPGVVAQTPVEPVAPVRTGPARAAPAPVAVPVAGAAPAAAAAAGEQVTVRRGDTLSKIANDVKPPDVTLDQMLVALFRGNADAFEGNNMNRLRSGAIITVPAADAVQSTSPQEATQVVRVQASDWRAYRDRIAAAAPTTEGTAGRTASGRIGAAVEERTPAAPAGGDQLRVSREAGKGAGAAAVDGVARDQQLREANARIAALEKTIADLQKAMELRSGTMAQVQAQADAAKGKAPAAAPATPAPAAAPAPAVVAKAPEPKAAQATPPVVVPPTAPVEPVKAEPPKAAAPAPAPSTPPAAAPAPKAEPPKVAEAPKTEPPKAAPPAPPKAPPKAAPPPPKPEPGFFEDLLASTPTWAIGGGALAILGGIAAIVAMRRRKTTKFEDSIISGTDIKTNTVFGSTGGGVVNTGDNSLASDFSREGLGNIDTDEVDPIAEAEVYLAYGRDAQAEEILKDALKKDPQRQEIYLKLLEIHAQHNKPSAFETVASELYAVSQGQGETWQKAVALGRQLDPGNPMFGDGGAPAPRAAAAVDSDTFTVGADYKPAATKDKALDLGLDEEISLSPTSGAAGRYDERETGEQTMIRPLKAAAAGAGAAVAGAGAAIATGSGDMLRGLKERAESTSESVADKVKAAADKFDLDFHLDESDKPAPMKRTPEPALAATAPSAPSSSPAEALARPAAALELDKLDLSFDPQKSPFEDPTPSVLDGQWHDAATKLDLAKAYQEMGDVEGAREILQEVLHEGDDEQKKEAQSILAKLA